MKREMKIGLTVGGVALVVLVVFSTLIYLFINSPGINNVLERLAGSKNRWQISGVLPVYSNENEGEVAEEQPLKFQYDKKLLEKVNEKEIRNAFLAHFSKRPESLQQSEMKNNEEERQFKYEIKNLMYQMQLMELSRIAESIRKDEGRFHSGYWKSYSFYEALTEEGKRYNANPMQAMFQPYEKDLADWKKLTPGDPTPWIAEGKYHTKLAWDARGGGYGDTVSRHAFQVFHAELLKAMPALQEAEKLSPRDPEIFGQMLAVAKGLGFPKARSWEIFEKGYRAYPTFIQLYCNMAEILLPKWHGSVPEVTDFVNWSYAHNSPEERARIYTTVIFSLIECKMEPIDFFKTYDFSWPLIQQGAYEKDMRFPMDRVNINRLCWLACAAGDKESARLLFGLIGEDADRQAWGTREKFERYKAWAMD